MLAPGLLLALPASPDPDLSRAVMLLIGSDASGSRALVINRPSTVKVSALLESLAMPWHGRDADVVWRGGPVDPQSGWVIHEPVEGGQGIAIASQVSLSTSPEGMRALADRPPDGIRFVLGSINWAPGELDAAMAREGCYVDAAPDLVFRTPPDRLFDHVCSFGMRPASAGFGARVRRFFGLAAAIPKATTRRRR